MAVAGSQAGKHLKNFALLHENQFQPLPFADHSQIHSFSLSINALIMEQREKEEP